MPVRPRKPKLDDLLFVGLAPRVLALWKDTGAIAWERRLKMAVTVVSIRIEGEIVYAGSSGEVWCLDALTGEILWHNGLKGYGAGYVTFASTETTDPAAASDGDSAAAAGAVAGGI